MLFDVQKDGDKIAPKWVAPEEEQEPNESRRSVQPLSSSHICGLTRFRAIIAYGRI